MHRYYFKKPVYPKILNNIKNGEQCYVEKIFVHENNIYFFSDAIDLFFKINNNSFQFKITS